MNALDELRENLREAARRDVAANRVRRRRRRAGGLLALVLIGGTAVAGAAELISIGEPVTDPRAQGAAYRPAPGTHQYTILARADSGRRLPYGLGVYTAANGKRCLIVGSLRGYTLGRERGGTFRPYPRGFVGSCNDPTKSNYDALVDGDRVLVYGLAPVGAKHVRVTAGADTDRISLSGKRAFLLVYEQVDRNAIRISYD